MRVRGSRFWGIVVLASLLLAKSSAGQATADLLPDPMSSLELLRYADRLELSPEQRRALESLHDAYKIDFKVLQEGPFLTALAKWAPVEEIPFRKPELAEVQAFTTAHETAMAGMAR